MYKVKLNGEVIELFSEVQLDAFIKAGAEEVKEKKTEKPN